MPRSPNTELKIRLNLELPIQVRERLEEIRVLSEAESVTEVIRRALSIYDLLLNMTVKEHGKVVIRSVDGIERELLLVP